MSDDKETVPKAKKVKNNWARRAIAKANAERFENGSVAPFDTLRIPYHQRKRRGKTADGEDKS